MEPRIQYAKTSDGVSIAYWAMGSGRRLLVSPPLPFSHLTLERQVRPLQAWHDHQDDVANLVIVNPRVRRVSFEGRGERDLKGVAEPVRVWRVRPNE